MRSTLGAERGPGVYLVDSMACRSHYVEGEYTSNIWRWTSMKNSIATFSRYDTCHSIMRNSGSPHEAVVMDGMAWYRRVHAIV